MTLETLDALSVTDGSDELGRCCGSPRWVKQMLESRPFRSREVLFEAATRIWRTLAPADWLRAFAQHPRLGELASLRTKFASTADWARSEQAGAIGASDEVLQALADANRTYEARFGYIFIACATGKPAEELLALLLARVNHAPDEELRIAAGEQEKITRLRLEKLLAP